MNNKRQVINSPFSGLYVGVSFEFECFGQKISEEEVGTEGIRSTAIVERIFDNFGEIEHTVSLLMQY